MMDDSALDTTRRPHPTLRQIGLIGAATFLLALAGALSFSRLERHAASESRAHYARQLEGLIELGNFSTSQRAIVNQIISHHGDHWCMPHMTVSSPWDFTSSLYFTVVLISTVGYGDLAPETLPGKAAAFMFSIVGVPLFLSFTVPLSELFIGALTKGVRRLYITRAVQNAMEAVEIKRGSYTSSSVPLNYGRRLTFNGVGTHHELWQVDLVALFLLLLMIAVIVAGLAPLLMFVEGWAPEDAWAFIWYTLTTIGLGDKTMDLAHPFFAIATLVLLLLLGTAAAQALMHAAHRVAMVVERTVAGEVSARKASDGGDGPWNFSDVLDRLATNDVKACKPMILHGNDEELEEVPAQRLAKNEMQGLLTAEPARSEIVARKRQE